MSLFSYSTRWLVSYAACEGVDVTTGRRDAVAWAERNRRYLDTGVMGEDDSVDDGEFGKKA